MVSACGAKENKGFVAVDGGAEARRAGALFWFSLTWIDANVDKSCTADATKLQADMAAESGLRTSWATNSFNSRSAFAACLA